MPSTTPREPAPGRPGFTIVEVLITLVLVTLLFGPMFSLIQMGVKRTYRGGDETIATIYATDIMELIRGGPYEAFYTGGKAEETDLPIKAVFGRSNFFKGYDPEKYDLERFDIRVDVGSAGKVPSDLLKLVRVRVSWMDRQSKIVKTIKMVTFYSPSTL